MRILALAGRRLAASIPTLVLILIGVFLLLQFAPGDTVDAMMAQMGGGDAATAKELRKFYGLDLSIPAQLGNYLWRLVRLDLGFSSIYGKPVASVILERLPPTILLMTASLSFAFFFGLLVRRDRRPRRQPLAGHADLDARPDLLRHALVLVRTDGDRGVFGLPAMAAARRLRGHRHRANRHLARVRYREPSGAADADARADLSGDLLAHHARLDAGGAQPRLCPDRARQRASTRRAW